MKRRVVITGAGIVSCIGNDQQAVTTSLREGKSGIVAMPEFAEMGLRSQVAGKPQIDLDALIDRKLRRFMGDAAAYAYLSLKDAIAQAGLTPEQVSNPRTGLIMGSGGASSANQVEAADILRSKGHALHGLHRVGQFIHRVCGQGHQFLHYLGLQHVCPLHRHGGSADCFWPARRDVCWRW